MPVSRRVRAWLGPHRAVVVVCLATTVVGLNATAIGVATRGIAGEFDLAPTTMSWILGAYLITAAAFSLAGGRLGDVVGRTRTFLAGVAVFAIGALLAAVAPTSTVLIAARVVEGIGAALVLPASIELVASRPPPGGTRSGFRARGIAYVSAFGIGPLFGGLLTDEISWRAIFWFEVVVLVLTGWLGSPLLRRAPTHDEPPTRDVAGALLSALFIVVVLGSLAGAPTWGWWSWTSALMATIGAVVGVLLVRVETRVAHPLIHRRVLTDRLVIGANTATMAASIGMIGLVYFFNLFAQSAAVFDAPAVAVAMALLPFTASIILFNVVARRLSARFGYRGPVLVGLGLATAGFFWLSTTGATTTEAALTLPLAVCGIGAGFANAGLTTPAVLAVPGTRLDEAAGLFSLTRYVGAALAIAIGTSTYLSIATPPSVPPQLAADVDPEVLVTGRGTFHDAVATLDEDLRAPFEAVALAQSADAFASTMRLAGITVAALTLVSSVLLRGGPDDPDRRGGRRGAGP